MATSLIAFICTYEVPHEVSRSSSTTESLLTGSQTLSSIFNAAYMPANKAAGAPTLYFLPDASKVAVEAARRPTRLPLDPEFESTFINWPLERIAQFLQEHSESRLNDRLFVVADRRTAADETLLLVQRWTHDDDSGFEDNMLVAVRIAAEDINAIATYVDVGLYSVVELMTEVDADGVVRRSKEPHGGDVPAPEEQH